MTSAITKKLLGEPELVILIAALTSPDNHMIIVDAPNALFKTNLRDLVFRIHELKVQFNFEIEFKLKKSFETSAIEAIQMAQNDFKIEDLTRYSTNYYYLMFQNGTSNADAYINMMSDIANALQWNMKNKADSLNLEELFNDVLPIKETDEKVLMNELCIRISKNGDETKNRVSAYINTHAQRYLDDVVETHNFKPLYEYYQPFLKACRQKSLSKSKLNALSLRSAELDYNIPKGSRPKESMFLSFFLVLHLKKVITLHNLSTITSSDEFGDPNLEWELHFEVDTDWWPIFNAPFSSWKNYKDLWLSEENRVAFFNFKVYSWKKNAQAQCGMLSRLIDLPEQDLPLSEFTNSVYVVDDDAVSVRKTYDRLKKFLGLRMEDENTLYLSSKGQNKETMIRLNSRYY